ncbi:MAG: hypothetical protein ABL309_04545 [Phycisphaerales bacterium]
MTENQTPAQSKPRSTAMSADATEMVSEPMSCPKCGYNLQGLFVGNPCPECGMPIGRRRRVAEDKMGDAPAGYLNTLATALVVFGMSGLLVPIGLLLDLFGLGYGAIVSMASLVVMPIAGLVILRKRVRPNLGNKAEADEEEWVGLRRIVVGGYACMYVFAALSLLNRLTSLSIPNLILLLPALGAGVGLCTAAWHISLLADWARDYSRAQQLRACSMGFGIYLFLYTLTFVIFEPLGGLIGTTPTAQGMHSILALIVTILSVFAFGGLLLVFIFSMLFASTVRWSIHNARTERERDARIAEKNRKRAEELAGRTAAASTAAGPAFESPTPEEAGVTLLDSGSDLDDEAAEEDDDREYNPYAIEGD